jgi:hypothetical protein
MEILAINVDANGRPTFGIPFSDNLYQGVLTANSEQTLTVPKSPLSDYQGILAVFSFAPGSSIWVSNNVTCTLPSGSIASGSSELNPDVRIVQGGDVLHFNTHDASDEYGVTFYAVYKR